MNLDRQHNEFVESLIANGSLRSPHVIRAFMTVKRHEFLPASLKTHAYVDHAIAIKTRPSALGKNECVASSTQPSLMAMMVEALKLEGGMEVLEIGTGTGYHAAILAEIVGSTGGVTSLEIDEQLAEEARVRFASNTTIRVMTANALEKVPTTDGFDRLVVTASAPDIPVIWVDALKPGGRCVIPLYFGGVDYLFCALKTSPESLTGSFECFTIFTGLDGSVRGATFSSAIGEERDLVLYDADHYDSKPSIATAASWIEKGPVVQHEDSFDSPDALEGFHVFTNLTGSFGGRGLGLAHSDSPECGYTGYAFYAWDAKGLVILPVGLRGGYRLEYGLVDGIRAQLEKATRDWNQHGKPNLKQFGFLFSSDKQKSDRPRWTMGFRSGFLEGYLRHEEKRPFS